MSEVSVEQYDLLNRLVDALRRDDRIEAIWLEGSIARGNADMYSDIDLHAYVPFSRGDPSRITKILADLPELLSPAGRVVYLRTFGSITTGLMNDGLRFDVALETEEDLKWLRPPGKILFDRTNEIWSRLRMGWETDPAPDLKERVEGAVGEFWRCMALLPTLLVRGERISMFQGHGFMIGLATEIVMGAEGRGRTAGLKRLNSHFTPEDRQELEAALPHESSPEAIAEAMVRLSRWVSIRGRNAAERLGFDYPEELETVVIRYLAEECSKLQRSGILRNPIL